MEIDGGNGIYSATVRILKLTINIGADYYKGK
jgi:hypothetical protein